MPDQKARFTVTRKVALGLAIIVVVGMFSMLFIYRGLNKVESAVQRLADVEAPLVGAAFEMELNVNGMALAVLKYLATLTPLYRGWAEKDEQDFIEYHATYMQLAKSAREQELGRQVGEHHAQFRALGRTLMGQRDKQEELFRTITDSLEEIDHVIDARLQPLLFSQSLRRLERVGPALLTADIEAEAAEVGQWVAGYQRLPTPEARQRIDEKLRGLQKALDAFRSLELTDRERQQALVLRKATAVMAAAITDVNKLADDIHAGRLQLIALRSAMDETFDNEIQILAQQGLEVPRQQASDAADEVLHALRYLIPLYLLVACVVGILFVYNIRLPLMKLRDGTRAIAGGDLTHRIGPTGNDEFTDLANQFNRMVEQLEATTVSRNLLEVSEEKLRHSVTDLRHEISERERAEQRREELQAELRRTERLSAMGSLVAGVAHEVRNPLFGISSTLDAMSARFGEPAEYQGYLTVLRTEVSRLSKLMSDLLSYGKPPTREFVSGSLSGVLKQVVETCTPLARQVGATIDNGSERETTVIRMDEGRLMQAFQNLIDNALQHAPPQTEVTIETIPVSDNGQRWIYCLIKDCGPGFLAEDLPRIFDPFFTRRRGGTGLGLSLVQRIVDEHGGKLFAANRPEGGAVMTVRLPAEQAMAAS